MTEGSGAQSARVDLLTAEVRTVMVGSRQVTLSVYRQLDTIEPESIEAMGRVRDSQDKEDGLYVIGRHRETGALTRSHFPAPSSEVLLKLDTQAVIETIALLSQEDDDDVSPIDTDTRIINSSSGRRLYAKDIAVAQDADCVIRVRRYAHNAQSAQSARYWRYAYGHAEGRREIIAAAEEELIRQRELRKFQETHHWDELPLIVLAGLR